eukprot:CAMPEP_0117420084 /NCGR_PEP_ID=MMETSP0758-20121206/1496_1 /TAXON_ID=63605 /ORGANISM="Percolomonas cosmopolitus, Strain AE-1 (ATCC 50343)" /LENGTH=368 /DNA_ID=CAMNT_0005201495 /DNA_START=345 /DNA_END=1451 /DNA_ORIENTATION=-
MNKRKFIAIGTGMFCADYRDSPYYFTASSESKLWIDAETTDNATPKIYVQLSRYVPPLFWLPIKASHMTLHRFYQDLIKVETISRNKHMQTYDDFMQQIEISDEKTKITPKEQQGMLMRVINEVNPYEAEREYPHNYSVYLGNFDGLSTLETAFMNSPYIFNTPMCLGTTNIHTKNVARPIARFRTVYSRSIITLEARYDLKNLLAAEYADSSWDVPIFAHIEYPENERFSSPIPQRINKMYETHFPKNVPFDAIASILGYKKHDHLHMAANVVDRKDKKKVAPQSIAYYAALLPKDGPIEQASTKKSYFENIYNVFYSMEDSIYSSSELRTAVAVAAAELKLDDEVQKMHDNESVDSVKIVMSKLLK